EILVINDGSVDRSLEIAEVYHAKYPDSVRVVDKKNGNYGSCINRGLQEATGRYIKVLDADDSFDSSGLEQIVSFLQ
ncbi:glycosyltransferase family A protein, partial [Acinetobacter sp. 163]|nr:glycosyltransferase family A protein [Acinetobacter sp. 163]